jgi:hypothetical protein
MRLLFILQVAFLGTLVGCSTVGTSGGIAAVDVPGGGFWYVRHGAASSRIFYCPPQAEPMPHRCVEAEVLDEYEPAYSAPPTPMAPSSPTPLPTTMVPMPAPAAVTPAQPPSLSVPAQPTQVPARSGCLGDWECKGGRVCRNSVCTQP